jgi:cytochrome c oxidase subunit 4
MSESHEAHHHIVPVPVYLTIFATLLVMTGVTVWAAFQDWGDYNIVIALAIAAFKGTLVVWYFMHVKFASRLTQLATVLGFLWLSILIGFTYSDVMTRDWVGGANGWAQQPIDETAGGHHDAPVGGSHGEGAAAEH